MGRWHNTLPVSVTTRRQARTEARGTVQLPPPARKAECCLAQRDAQGRLPIGYCGPDCERRPS